MTMYVVRSIAGGTVCRTRSLEKAAQEACGHMIAPYVETARGRMPVVQYEIDGKEQYEVGAFGETYDALRARMIVELDNGDRAFIA